MVKGLDSGLRRNDGKKGDDGGRGWIPACAGMTVRKGMMVKGLDSGLRRNDG